MRKITTAKAFITFLALLLPSCEQDSDPSLFKPNIEIGAPGLIGNYKFYLDPDKRIEPLFNSTSAFIVYDDISNDPKATGTALFVKNTQDGAHYLITAAHNVYDFSSGNLIGNRVAFGHLDDEYSYDFFNLEFLNSQKTFYSFANDFIAIPVSGTNLRPALSVNLLHPFPKDFINSEHKRGNLVAVSVLAREHKKGFIKFYQTDFILMPNERIAGKMKTSLDGIHGMSGSPVFYLQDNETHLLGVLSSTNKNSNCTTFSLSRCHNLVAPTMWTKTYPE